MCKVQSWACLGEYCSSGLHFHSVTTRWKWFLRFFLPVLEASISGELRAARLISVEGACPGVCILQNSCSAAFLLEVAGPCNPTHRSMQRTAISLVQASAAYAQLYCLHRTPLTLVWCHVHFADQELFSGAQALGLAAVQDPQGHGPPKPTQAGLVSKDSIPMRVVQSLCLWSGTPALCCQFQAHCNLWSLILSAPPTSSSPPGH